MGNVRGIASNPNDLLDKIRIFLINEGFTVNKWEAVGNGYRLHVQRNSFYLNFRSYINEAAGWAIYNGYAGTGIAVSGGTGYDAGQSFGNQPGIPYLSVYWGSGPCGVNLGGLPAGPYISHQFFHDGNNNLLFMVEQAPNSWRHIIAGESIDKSGAGSWTGGQYFGSHAPGFQAGTRLDGTNDSPDMNPMLTSAGGQGSLSFLRADVDTYVGKWLQSSYLEGGYDASGNTKAFTTGHVSSLAGDSGSDWTSNWTSIPKMGRYLRKSLFNIQDSRTILLPIMFFVHRDAGGASFLGTLPNIYITGAKWNGVDYGQDVIVGSDTYRMFNGFVVKVV